MVENIKIDIIMSLFNTGRKILEKRLQPKNIEILKKQCRLVFVDDIEFPVINTLKMSGWSNVIHIHDISSLDQCEIRDANIIFLDIQGVGKILHCEKEGLGLILPLREKYPNKMIVVYSAEEGGNISAFSEHINAAHKRISRNVEPVGFQMKVERYVKEYYSVDWVVEQIGGVLSEDAFFDFSKNEIKSGLYEILKKKEYSEKFVKDIFKIENLDRLVAISKIVSIFFL